jgi:4-hydroxybenzoate polyprenyltransferase
MLPTAESADKTRVASVRAFIRGALKLMRHFPYTELLVVFFPFYAYLIALGYITSPSALLLMVPFILTDAVGFTYNNIVDVNDPSEKNPIVAGDITLRQAQVVFILLVATPIISFVLQYTSLTAWAIFFVYYFFGLAYSGLGLRFKESIVGPIVASFIIWTGGPLVLTAEFNVFNGVTVGLLLGTFFVYIGRETYHTIIDYDNDLASKNQTLAVTLGLRGAYAVKDTTFLIGSALFLFSIYSYFQGWPSDFISILLVLLVIVSAALVIAYDLGVRFYDPRNPWLFTKLFYIWYAAVILKFDALIALLFIWVFLTSKRS